MSILAIKQWELGLVVKDLQSETETSPAVKQVVRVLVLLQLSIIPVISVKYGWVVNAFSLDHIWYLGLSFVLLGLICHGCYNLNKCDAFRNFNLKVIALIMIPFSLIIIAEIISIVFSFHPGTLIINGFYLYEIVRFVWIMVDACNLVIVYQMLETQGDLGKILVQHKDASFEALDELLGEHATFRGTYVELGTYNKMEAKTLQS